MTGQRTVGEMFASMDGLEFEGGCDHCDAYQSVRMVSALEHRFIVHHDDWCPVWTEMRKR